MRSIRVSPTEQGRNPFVSGECWYLRWQIPFISEEQSIKFLYRFLHHTLIFLAVLLPLQIVSMIALAVYVPYQNYRVLNDPQRRSWKLPKYLRWFDNADIYPELGRDYTTYLFTVLPKGPLYRWYWLTIRNPLNYFGYTVLGVRNDPISEVTIRKSSSDPDIDIGDKSSAGKFYLEVSILKKVYYEYYYIYRYPYFKNHCFRFRLGWKFDQSLTSLVRHNKINQFVYVISPFHSYTGR